MRKINSLLFLITLLAIISSIRTNSQTWNPITNGVTNYPQILQDVLFLNSTTGFVVGREELIIKSGDSGFTWRIINRSMSGALYSISFCDALNGLAVGQKIYRTIDGGETWTKVDSIMSGLFRKVKYYSNDLALTFGYFNGNGFIKKSIDGGLNWFNLNTPVFAGSVLDMEIINKQTYVALIDASNPNLLKTTNGGDSWSQFSIGPERFFNIEFVSEQIGYVVGLNGIIYRTSDGGQVWNAIKSHTNSLLYDIKFSGNNGIIVGDDGTIVRSIDNGLTWSNQSNSITESLRGVAFIDLISCITVGSNNSIYKSSYGNFQIIFPNGDENIHAGTVTNIKWSSSIVPTIRIDYSTNNGANWVMIASNIQASIGNFNWNVPNLGVTKSDCRIKITSSENSNIYDESDNTFTITVPQYLISASSNPVAGGTISGSGTYNLGQTITLSANANTGYTFQNWSENNVVVSSNPNYSFEVTGNRNLVANFTVNQYNILVSVNPPNGGLVTGGGVHDYGSQVTLQATPNQGYSFISWTEQGTVLSTNSTYQFNVSGDRNIIANFTQIIYSVTTASHPTYGGSTTGSGLYPYGDQVTVKAEPFESFTFIHWYEATTIVSTDKEYKFPILTSRSLVARFNRPPKFTIEMPSLTVQVHNVPVAFKFQYEGTDPDNDPLTFSLKSDTKPEGSEITANGLFSWAPSMDQAGKEYTINVQLTDDFSSVLSTAILRASAAITDLNSLSEIPEKFMLNQNYPNPFNPTTVIQFSIPQEVFVTLSVFNTLGEQVAELVNQHLSPSTYSVNFDAKDLPNGIYFYKIKAGEFEQTKKMILIK